MLDEPVSGVRVSRATAGAMTIVAAHGELDHGGVAALRASVQEALVDAPMILAFDMRGVTFIDCETVGELVALGQRCEADGRRLLLVRGAPSVDRVLSACGLQDRFDFVDGLDQLPSGEPTDALGLEPLV